ncbi:6-bladed beta-propeller protein [Parabacteroides chinchillae]|uniref:6-bladed beta-propeller protein n=2 Tax=Parabacteroides chinchillae TaxID=871327 RepID=A0A8G2BXX5_9BACT|nr:6-bladed beta-propeller protein [Parabacteroides chinchillae]
MACIMSVEKILISVIVITGLCGCKRKMVNESAQEIISVNPYEAEKSVNLSEFVDSVKCIRLQTDSDDFMGRIREIVIREQYIYAIDITQQMIFLFDKTGKFVTKLNKRGEGPGEYRFIGPVFIDENEEYIELIDYGGKEDMKLKYSNISFDLLESHPFPHVRCNSCKEKDGIYYFSPQHLDDVINGKKVNANLVILDRERNKKVFFDKAIETNGSSFCANIESFARNDKDELFVSFMYDNTFYKLDTTEVSPAITVDFGKYGMDNSVGLEPLGKQIEYIRQLDGLASFPVLNINNSDIMSFSYYFKETGDARMYREQDYRMYIRLKEDNKVYHVKQIKNDITDFPENVYISSYFFDCAHEVWYDDYLVDIVIPSSYFYNRNADKIYIDGLGEITSEDNPVIVMMKLKK